jgi:hypothetical protein
MSTEDSVEKGRIVYEEGKAETLQVAPNAER